MTIVGQRSSIFSILVGGLLAVGACSSDDSFITAVAPIEGSDEGGDSPGYPPPPGDLRPPLPDPTAPVGTLPGVIDVKPSGALSYSIPIWVPKGRQGMEPELALTYSSHGSNGSIGVGWSLTGTSQVSVCMKTHSTDGMAGYDEYSHALRSYCLGSERLVRFSGDDLRALRTPPGGFQPIEFRTELDEDVRVFRWATAGGGSIWQSYLPNGLIRTFGESVSARNKGLQFSEFGFITPLESAWLLEREEDRYGNSIEYQYTMSGWVNAQRWLSRVDFSHHSDFGADRFVEFEYEEKPDRLDHYYGGLLFRNDKQLRKIHVGVGSQKSRTIRLAYTSSSRSQRSLLTEVKLCDRLGFCAPSTKLRYAQPPGVDPVAFDFVAESNKLVNGTVVRVDHKRRPKLADIDNDGDDDLLFERQTIWKSEDGTRVEYQPVLRRLGLWSPGRSEVLTTLAGGIDWNEAAGPAQTDCIAPGHTAPPKSYYVPGLAGVDINSDGAMDLSILNNTKPLVQCSQGGKREDRRRLFFWNEISQKFAKVLAYDSFFPETYGPYTGDQLGDSILEHRGIFLDFDGDGRPDFVKPDGSVWLNDGSGLHASQYAVAPLQDYVGWAGLDLDGSGTQDLLRIHGLSAKQTVSGTQTYLSSSLLKFGDTQVQLDTLLDGVDLRGAVFADVNGDALADIVVVQHPFKEHYRKTPPKSTDNKEMTFFARPVIYLNTGNGFRKKLDSQNISARYPTITNSCHEAFGCTYKWTEWEPQAVDANGDGRTDILITERQPLHDGQPERQVVRLWLSTGMDFVEVEIGEFDKWPFVAGDVDGDGILDLVRLHETGPWSDSGYIPTDRGHPSEIEIGRQFIGETNRFFDQLVEIENGLGAIETIEYAAHSFEAATDGPAVFEQATGCVYPERCDSRGLPLVYRLRQSQPGHSDRSFRYAYHGARTNVRGRGRIGFSSFVRVDEASGLETKTYFDLTRFTRPAVSEKGKQFDWDIYPFSDMPSQRVSTITVDQETRTTTEKFVYNFKTVGPEGVGPPGGERYRVTLKSQKTTVSIDGNDPAISMTASHAYDAHANRIFTSAINADGETTQTWTTIENNETDWLLGLPTKVTTTSFPVAPAPGRTQIVSMTYYPTGALESFTFEGDESNPASELLVTTYTRDNTGQVTSTERCNHDQTDCRTEETTYGVENIYPILRKNALGQETENIFDPSLDRVAFTLDLNGAVTSFAHDGLGRPTKTTHPDGTWEARAYSQVNSDPASGTRVRSEFKDGRFVEKEYDNRNKRVVDRWPGPTGNPVVSVTSYDGRGRPVLRWRQGATASEAPAISTTEWDNLDRITARTSPANEVEQWDYPNYFSRKHTDAVGRETLSVANTDGNIVSRTQYDTTPCLNCPVAQTTTFEYGAFGRLIRATDPAANATEIAYDGLGRRSVLLEPNSGGTSLFYSPFGELTKRIDHGGAVINWTHDPLGRLTLRSNDDGTNTYSYDVGTGAIGQLSSATSADGVTTEFEYDGIGRPLVTRWELSGTIYEVESEYDSYGRLLRTLYPQLSDGYQLSVRNEYDQTGANLVKVFDETDQRVLWRSLARDNYNRITSETKGPISMSHTFDPVSHRLSRTTAVNNSVSPAVVLADVTYDYHPGGQLAARTDVSDPTYKISETAVYDGLGRLSAWTTKRGSNAPRTREYGFNVSGTIASVVDTQGLNTLATESYSYPAPGSAKPHGVSSIGDRSYVYDDIGRLRTVTQSENVVRQIDYTVDNLPKTGTNSGESFAILYDAFGRRFRKLTQSGATTYVGGLYEIRDAGGGDESHVFFAAGSQLEYRIGNSTPSIAYVATDPRLGSPIARLEENGEVEQFYFEPYGKRISKDGTSFDEMNHVSTLTNGFTGHEHDRALGWINMVGRAYDPESRSFMTPDPVDSVAGRYSYVSHDPFNSTDPSGYQGVPTDGARRINGGIIESYAVLGGWAIEVCVCPNQPAVNISASADPSTRLFFAAVGLGGGVGPGAGRPMPRYPVAKGASASSSGGAFWRGQSTQGSADQRASDQSASRGGTGLGLLVQPKKSTDWGPTGGTNSTSPDNSGWTKPILGAAAFFGVRAITGARTALRMMAGGNIIGGGSKLWKSRHPALAAYHGLGLIQKMAKGETDGVAEEATTTIYHGLRSHPVLDSPIGVAEFLWNLGALDRTRNPTRTSRMGGYHWSDNRNFKEFLRDAWFDGQNPLDQQGRFAAEARREAWQKSHGNRNYSKGSRF